MSITEQVIAVCPRSEDKKANQELPVSICHYLDVASSSTETLADLCLVA